jgi:uncharacterized protein (DUF1800 family)
MNDTRDPRWAWQPYRPSDKSPWDLKKVGHLYRRTTFGATWAQLQTGLEAGPEKTIDSLFKGGQEDPDIAPWMEKFRKGILEGNNGQQATAYWLHRMLYGPNPLREKITLFWHNHFATSNAKVQNAGHMLRQYELMQQHALGSFRSMVREMTTDPAMMIWLDTRLSKKGMPNENYARELMELFTLGIGNYTEKDIREAARAFTGWEIKEDKAVFNPGQHDDGEKTVLGQTGKWQADDIVRICLEQKVAPLFIVGKLYRFLISETVPGTPEILEPLALQFRKSDYDIGALINTMVRSNLFFSAEVYRTRVKSPVDFALGIVRALEGRIAPAPLGQALEALGQRLFYPPSVKGWDGGPAWLNGQTLLFRQNLALGLTSTEDQRFGRRSDPAVLVRKYDRKTDAEVAEFFLRLFLQDAVPAESRSRLLSYQDQASRLPVPVYWTKEDASDQRVRTLCHLVLALPEFQLD